VNIFEREAFKAEVDKVTIAPRQGRHDRQPHQEDDHGEDGRRPVLLPQVLPLLQEAIDDYKAQRISEAELLAKVTTSWSGPRRQARRHPAAVRAATWPRPSSGAEVACDIERIIRQHAIVRWRENTDAQNAMRNDLDDLLFSLQRTKGITLTYEQMDAILEAILRIARHRSDV
jgi:type I restriction enzyme R subunit